MTKSILYMKIEKMKSSENRESYYSRKNEV